MDNKVFIPHKKDILMESLKIFFSNSDNINIIIPIINGTSNISLRLIDWFVTNYSKKNNTSIDNNNLSTRKFIVYIDYKSQLKAYTKKQFDPFCRRERIRFYYDNQSFIVTTVGQLNFFRWAIKFNIINYIYNFIKDIESDMNFNVKKNKPIKDSRKKRQELSISASKRLNKHKINITVSFQ